MVLHDYKIASSYTYNPYERSSLGTSRIQGTVRNELGIGT